MKRLGVALSAAALVAAPLVALADSAQAATGCSVTYSVSGQWPGGFQGGVTLRNLGDPLTSWALSFSFPSGQKVQQSWGATNTQSGADVTFRSESWNGAVPTNGTASIGFIGSWTGSNGAPASFSVNGVP